MLKLLLLEISVNFLRPPIAASCYWCKILWIFSFLFLTVCPRNLGLAQLASFPITHKKVSIDKSIYLLSRLEIPPSLSSCGRNDKYVVKGSRGANGGPQEGLRQLSSCTGFEFLLKWQPPIFWPFMAHSGRLPFTNEQIYLLQVRYFTGARKCFVLSINGQGLGQSLYSWWQT